MTRQRILALCCDGLPQRHFLWRLGREHELAGVVLHAAPGARGSLLERLRRHANPIRLVRHLLARGLVARALARAEPERRRLFFVDGAPPQLPSGVPLLRAGDVNAPEVVALARGSGADALLVNGTNLLRAPLLDLADRFPLGILNLHTGLSPYTRGGNCNLWALLEGHPEWIGVTVHHIDPGIDSGDIVLSAQTPLVADDLYEAIDARNFRQGFDLLLLGLRLLAEGRAPRVPQWQEGRVYLRRTGHVYEPWLQVRANRAIAHGAIARYLESKVEIDRAVRTVGAPA